MCIIEKILSCVPFVNWIPECHVCEMIIGRMTCKFVVERVSSDDQKLICSQFFLIYDLYSVEVSFGPINDNNNIMILHGLDTCTYISILSSLYPIRRFRIYPKKFKFIICDEKERKEEKININNIEHLKNIIFFPFSLHFQCMYTQKSENK